MCGSGKMWSTIECLLLPTVNSHQWYFFLLFFWRTTIMLWSLLWFLCCKIRHHSSKCHIKNRHSHILQVTHGTAIGILRHCDAKIQNLKMLPKIEMGFDQNVTMSCAIFCWVKFSLSCVLCLPSQFLCRELALVDQNGSPVCHCLVIHWPNTLVCH